MSHHSHTTYGAVSLSGNSHADWTVALLAQIRDELKTLNQLLHCHNAVDIPNILRRIDANTKPKARPKTKAKARK